VFLTIVPGNPALAPYATRIIWLALWPLGLAVGQWILVRRYLPEAPLWALATFVGASLERMSAIFLHQAIIAMIVSLPQTISILQLLRPMFGGANVPDVLALVLVALCQGAALSVPSGFVLPGTKSTRVFWVIALMLTTFVVVVIVGSLLHELERQLLGSYPKLEYYPIDYQLRLIAAYALPALLGWLVVSLVSGSLMYWNLRRSSAAVAGQVYARFD
jgi:hypothetical protein